MRLAEGLWLFEEMGFIEEMMFRTFNNLTIWTKNWIFKWEECLHVVIDLADFETDNRCLQYSHVSEKVRLVIEGENCKAQAKTLTPNFNASQKFKAKIVYQILKG